MPFGSPHVEPPAAADLPSESGPGLFHLAWRRKWLLALGAVVGLALGSLYYARQIPLYQSTAQLMVVQKRPQSVAFQNAGANAYLTNFVSTHVSLIKSPLIVERAVQASNLRSLQSIATHTDAVGAIIPSLSVSVADKETAFASGHIIALTYQGVKPADCRLILNAVIDGYQTFLDDNYENENSETLKLITEKSEELQKQLVKKEAEYQKFREQAPLLWNGKAGYTFSESRLAAIDAERSALRLRWAKVEPRLEAIKKALNEGQDHTRLLAMISGSDIHTGAQRDSTRTLGHSLLPLILDEKTLSERYGARHPKLEMVRLRIQLTRDFFAQSSVGGYDARAQVDANEQPLLPDLVQSYVQSLEQELKQVETLEPALAKLFEEEHKAAKALASYEYTDNQFRNDIARSEQFYDNLMTQLQGLDIGKDFGGYITTVIAPPQTGVRVEPKISQVFPVALLLGLLGGFGLAYLAEVLDKSFRSVDEIRDRLGLPVECVPFFTPDGEALRTAATSERALDPMLCSYHQPQSVAAEAYRVVRTSLFFSSAAEGHKVIQITSPDKGDGKTTLVANLAVCIAKSGKQVVLLDADFRHPKQHEIFGLINKIGLVSVLAGEAEPQDAIQQTSIPTLSVVPCGPPPADPAELLTSPRFEEFLSVIREQYDFVLIDTPPLLAITDPSVVAARVDGVFLVVEIGKKGRSHAVRAMEILGNVGAKPLGVVVNGLRAPSSGYGAYGYYGYGYGYGDSQETSIKGQPVSIPNEGEHRSVQDKNLNVSQ